MPPLPAGLACWLLYQPLYEGLPLQLAAMFGRLAKASYSDQAQEWQIVVGWPSQFPGRPSRSLILEDPGLLRMRSSVRLRQPQLAYSGPALVESDGEQLCGFWNDVELTLTSLAFSYPLELLPEAVYPLSNLPDLRSCPASLWDASAPAVPADQPGDRHV